MLWVSFGLSGSTGDQSLPSLGAMEHGCHPRNVVAMHIGRYKYQLEVVKIGV